MREHKEQDQGVPPGAAASGRQGDLPSFAEFWLFYLREHSRPATRNLHYVGTSLVVLTAVGAAATGRWRLLAALPVAGWAGTPCHPAWLRLAGQVAPAHGFAWAAHAAVERNRPATFTHPFWSLIADFRMWALWLSGRLGGELERAGIGRGEPGHGR